MRSPVTLPSASDVLVKVTLASPSDESTSIDALAPSPAEALRVRTGFCPTWDEHPVAARNMKHNPAVKRLNEVIQPPLSCNDKRIARDQSKAGLYPEKRRHGKCRRAGIH